MPHAQLLQDTAEADAAQALLADLLRHAESAGAQALDLLVSGTGRATVLLRAAGSDAPLAASAEEQTLRARSEALARGRVLHAAVRDGTARLWIRAGDGDPAIAWRAPRRAGRRHPLLPAWRAMEDGTDFLLGAPEGSAHGRLLQAARAADVPALRRLAEGFAARPARLWRRGGEGIALYGKGAQGEAMADGFEAVLLPVPDAGPSPSETGKISR